MNATDLIGLTGTAAFTISGYLVGYRKGLDILGVIIVSLLTAIGGGIIRDTVIGRLPVVFVDNTSLMMIAVTLMLAWVFNLAKRERRILTWSFFLADAIGLVAFSITGAQIGLLYELNFLRCFFLQKRLPRRNDPQAEKRPCQRVATTPPSSAVISFNSSFFFCEFLFC